MKRILAFIGILVVVGLILGTGYYFRYREPAPTTAQNPSGSTPLPTGSGSGSGLPVGTGVTLGSQTKFGPASAAEVGAYFVSSDDSILILAPDGKIKRLSKGAEDVLSSSPLSEIVTAGFSADGKFLLIGSGGRLNAQYTVFDVAAKTWRPLEAGASGVAWSPLDDRVAYFSSTNGGVASLNLADPKSKPVVLMKFSAQDQVLAWPAADKIVVADRPTAFTSGSAWVFNLKSKTLTSLALDMRANESLWNFPFTRGLEFIGSERERGGVLALTDGTGKITQQLTFLTLPSKCVFSSELLPIPTSTPKSPAQYKDVLFCGVPKNSGVFAQSALPDDYAKRAVVTDDDIYRVDLSSGNISVLLSDSDSELDASQLVVKNSRLYFINRLNSRLYSLLLN